MEMVSFRPNDYCMDCDTPHSIDVYDIYNNRIPYHEVEKVMNRKELSYMKCRRCKREYNIDWSHNTRMPRPIIVNIGLSNFLQQFQQ